jgi:hypothetical protein
LRIAWRTRNAKVTKRLTRVRGSQKRPGGLVPYTVPQEVHIRPQPDRNTLASNDPTVSFGQECPAARRKHASLLIQQAADDLSFLFPEKRFTVPLKYFSYGHVCCHFNLGIGIQKWYLQKPRKRHPDRSLARSHHADEHDGLFQQIGQLAVSRLKKFRCPEWRELKKNAIYKKQTAEERWD